MWLQPLPQPLLAHDSEQLSPESAYERSEAVELAFIVALQHLPGAQRAVLILRDVLGYSAREVAAILETTTASVTSALRRARLRVEQRLPASSQQQTLQALGDARVNEIVNAYIDAWNRGDVDAVVALLSSDATFSMPPLSTWYCGREAIGAFLAQEPLGGEWEWRVLRARANGQEALAFYIRDTHSPTDPFVAWGLNVLAFEGSLISAVTAFLMCGYVVVDRDELLAMMRQPADPARLRALFSRFGLPARLPLSSMQAGRSVLHAASV
jgi:RNA polymerase sigma-70 factor (ECF subfamily)